MKEFFKKAFADMKESAKAQHEVDKANFDAVKAESKAQWEEAKAMGRPEAHKAAMQARRVRRDTKQALRKNSANIKMQTKL